MGTAPVIRGYIGQLIRVTIPTPHQHPGWIEKFYVSTKTYDYKQLYARENPEPSRGQAWDKTQRTIHATWKESFCKWLESQPGVSPLTFTEY